MSESVSDDEKAGKPMPPLVELRPCGPPLQITEAGPLPLPPPPPFDRTAALAGIQTAFAQLTDDELEVARLRMLGIPYASISEELDLLDDEVEKLWKRARRKLGTSMFGSVRAPSPETVTPASPIRDRVREHPKNPQALLRHSKGVTGSMSGEERKRSGCKTGEMDGRDNFSAASRVRGTGTPIALCSHIGHARRRGPIVPTTEGIAMYADHTDGNDLSRLADDGCPHTSISEMTAAEA